MVTTLGFPTVASAIPSPRAAHATIPAQIGCEPRSNKCRSAASPGDRVGADTRQGRGRRLGAGDGDIRRTDESRFTRPSDTV